MSFTQSRNSWVTLSGFYMLSGIESKVVKELIAQRKLKKGEDYKRHHDYIFMSSHYMTIEKVKELM